MNNILFRSAACFMLFTFSSLLFSCKNEKSTILEEDEDHVPTITFTAPASGQEFTETDTVNIRINISSEDDIHEYEVKVKNLTENKDAYKYEGHSHEKTATVDLQFIPNVSTDAIMQLTLTTMDHNSHVHSKQIQFKVKNTIQANKPVIQIISPDMSMYEEGDRVAIKGNVTHNANLKNVRVLFTRATIPAIDYTESSINSNSYSFDTAYTIPSGHADFKLTVTATDINDISETKTYDFHVH